jgi:DNA (cytosine-5)-methyltransferase 1
MNKKTTVHNTPKANSYTYIDLFSGCGGASLGLFKAGWKGLFAIEKSKMAFETLKFNLIDKHNHFEWPQWLPQKAHNINTFLKEYKDELIKLDGKVTLLIGGPPCQGFSFAGRRDEKDKRNKLVNAYIKFVALVKPKIVFFENVKGFTIKFQKNDSSGRVYSDYVVKKLEELGYKVHAQIINFGDFGIPQNRKRFILVGVRNGNAEIFFKKLVQEKWKFLKQKRLTTTVSLRDAISDLERNHGKKESKEFKNFYEGIYGNEESNYQKLLRKGSKNILPDSHRFPNHSKKTIKKFRYILQKCIRGKNIGDSTKKKFKLNKHCIVPLDSLKRSPTLTTLPDDYIHYIEPRILSVREYARIQSFDDWFEIKGAYTTGGKLRRTAIPRYTQIGNAIPPLFMEWSGIILKGMSV